MLDVFKRRTWSFSYSIYIYDLPSNCYNKTKLYNETPINVVQRERYTK